MFSRLPLRIITRVLDNLDYDTLNAPFGFVDDTFLICLAKQNHIHLVRYFTLRPGVDIDQRNGSSYHDNALSWAVFNGHSEVVKILIAAGADVNMTTNVSGKNLLYWAYSQRCWGIFKYLIINGCILTTEDYYGQSFLDRIPDDSAYKDLIRTYRSVLKKILHTYLYHMVARTSVSRTGSRDENYERSLVPLILAYYPGV